MARKTGLGKGIDSIVTPKYRQNVEKSTELSTKEIENVDKTVNNSEKEPIVSVKIAEIEPNREQPRKQFEEDALRELSESIRIHGMIQPIIVRKNGEHYEIIAGERRWRAAKLAGLGEVPVIIREYTDKESTEIALIENIQRQNLNPMEEALAYQRLTKEFRLKQDEVARRVSKSRTAVANLLRLLKLDPSVQAMVSSGALSEGHARALLGLQKAEDQVKAAETVVKKALNVRETEKLVKQMNQPAPIRVTDWKEEDKADYARLENDLKAVMGTKVSISRKEKEKGSIHIEYYSLEELERLTSMLKRGSEGYDG